MDIFTQFHAPCVKAWSSHVFIVVQNELDTTDCFTIESSCSKVNSESENHLIADLIYDFLSDIFLSKDVLEFWHTLIARVELIKARHDSDSHHHQP